MSILIVEDNPINAKVLEVNLQNNGYQTILAKSAKMAMEHLTSTPQIQLIIADIMMPEMDGLELLAKIKEQPEWKDIPVIMCSALADVETVKKAVDAGCKHYLIKPIKTEHLLAKVQDALEHEKPVLKNKNEIKSLFCLDEESYQEIVQSFSSIINNDINLLEKRMNGKAEAENILDLSILLESAVCLGAERIQHFFDELNIKNEKIDEKIKDSECRLLLRELKILRDALPSLTPKEEPKVKKEDKKDDSEKQVAENKTDTKHKKN
jgi:CheY-like chemotaxis protein